MRLKIVIGLLTFLLFSGPLFPEEPVMVPRRLMLFFEAGQPAALGEGDLLLLYESLLVKLDRDVDDIVLFELDHSQLVDQRVELLIGQVAEEIGALQKGNFIHGHPLFQLVRYR